MNDKPPPYVYEGLDPAPESTSAIADVTDAVKGAAHRVSDAIESGRKPGMPLSILANVAREAPLGSLLVAFLLGPDAVGITGRLISAQWDPWRERAFGDRLRGDPDLGKLRRIDDQFYVRVGDS